MTNIFCSIRSLLLSSYEGLSTWFDQFCVFVKSTLYSVRLKTKMQMSIVEMIAVIFSESTSDKQTTFFQEKNSLN